MERSGLSHPTSPSLLLCSTGLPSPAALESHHIRAAPTTLVIMPQFWPRICHTTPSILPRPLERSQNPSFSLCSSRGPSAPALSFRKGQALRAEMLFHPENASSSKHFLRKGHFKQISLSKNLLGKNKKKKKDVQHFSYPVSTALNEK